VPFRRRHHRPPGGRLSWHCGRHSWRPGGCVRPHWGCPCWHPAAGWCMPSGPCTSPGTWSIWYGDIHVNVKS